MGVRFWSSAEKSGLEADMWESWAAAESTGVNETAQGKEKRAGEGSSDILKGDCKERKKSL